MQVDFDSAGDIEVNHIARWNGNVWKSLGSGVNGGIITAEIDKEAMFMSVDYSTLQVELQ